MTIVPLATVQTVSYGGAYDPCSAEKVNYSIDDSCRSLATSLIFHIESEQMCASTTDRKRNQMTSSLGEQERPDMKRIPIEVKELELS